MGFRKARVLGLPFASYHTANENCQAQIMPRGQRLLMRAINEGGRATGDGVTGQAIDDALTTH